MKLIISTPDHFCSNCQQLSLCLYNSRMGVSHKAPVHSLSLSPCLPRTRPRLTVPCPGCRGCPGPGPGGPVLAPPLSRARPGSGETFMGRKPGPETAAAAWPGQPGPWDAGDGAASCGPEEILSTRAGSCQLSQLGTYYTHNSCRTPCASHVGG